MSAEQVSQKYTSLQSELEDLVVTRQKLETQYQENRIVDDEFSGLKPETQIYKLIGGVLLPMEQEEAKSNVQKRLEFIEGEIKRCEENLKSKQMELESTKNELLKLRS